MSVSAMFVIGSLLFGGVMLTIGVVAGLWIAASLRVVESPVMSEADHAEATQRTRMVSSSLIRLVQNVVGDVSAHSAKIEAISADLQDADEFLAESRALVGSAPERILAANIELQEQLAKAKQQIEAQAAQLRAREFEARTDLLTALFNRRAFEEEMGKQVSLWDRKGIAFSLVLLDIDHFKCFNDLHGHQTGDQVLREVAHCIVSQLRGMDTAFRYGGEEFAVILPTTNLGDACIFAERIRKAIECCAIACAGKQLKVTTSVGIVSAIESEQAAQMIQRADSALYEAKQSGRNCIRWHDGVDILPPTSLEASAASDEVSSMRQQVKQISMTALNRELTKHVCNSRRCCMPLSVICVRAETGNTAIGCSKTLSRGLPDVIDVMLSNSEETGLLVPLTAGELLVVLPGQTSAAATDWLENVVCSAASVSISVQYTSQLQYCVCELLPHETAEQLIIRAREKLLVQPLQFGQHHIVAI